MPIFSVTCISTGPAMAWHAVKATDQTAWEVTLFTHLDQLGLLLINSGPPLSGEDIASIINLDERAHFFVAGIDFLPPQQKLAEEYTKREIRIEDVPRFGLAKPDFLEVSWCEGNCKYIWRVIDAKASKDVKTSHLVQTYFYYLCFALILPPSFIPAPTVAVWLPSSLSSSTDSSETLLSLTTLHPTPITHLVAPLSNILFTRVPAILSNPRSEISWHFNPLCRSCSYASTCRARVEEEQGLGKAGEISLNDADEVRRFLKRVTELSPAHRDREIEDLMPNIPDLTAMQEQRSELGQLAALVENSELMASLAEKWPASVKRVSRVLAGSSHSESREISLKTSITNPENAWGNQPYNCSRINKCAEGTYDKLFSCDEKPFHIHVPFQPLNRRIYTLPSSEDIAIHISLIIDPSRPTSVSSISEICISTEVNPSYNIIAQRVKSLPEGPELLVNRSKVMSAQLPAVIAVDPQFEVLLKLQGLWDARIDGCPETPLLATQTTVENNNGSESKGAVLLHNFDLIAGSLEVAPERDRDRGFFDYILVEESDENSANESIGDTHLPLEALFNDLHVSGVLFPLNRYARNKWEDSQAEEVKEGGF
ncbi:hypothetical protein K439DRAFT_1616799 [Ramaria rubella]|nr:hypothetical protein K439DRAFT_1616799 [Ramaria rubella]